MRTSHWKLLPGFLLGLLVMLATGCAVSALFAACPGLLKIHWIVWLVLTVLFPVAALILLGKAEQLPALYMVSYLVNALGSGCAFGVVLGFLEVPMASPLVQTLLLALLLPLTLALLNCLVAAFCRWDRAVAIVFTVLGAAAVIGSLFLTELWHPMAAFGAMFGFLFYLAFPIACGKTLSKPWDVLEHLAFSGFGAYLVVVIAAVCILAEDGPDGLLDGLFDGIVWYDPEPQKQQHLQDGGQM